MSRAEAEALDPWWIINVIFYPKDSDGHYLPMPDQPQEPDNRPKNPKEAFFRKRWLEGFQDWQIEKLWEDYERGHGKKSHGQS